VLVGRVAQATDVDFGAMRQDSARVRVGAKSPFTMILAHPRVSDAAEWQIVNRRLKGAVVNVGIARARRAQNLFGYRAVLGEQIQTQRAGTCVNELDHFLNAIDFQTGKIGPKISSCIAGESGETFVSTVGAMKRSFRSCWPPWKIVPLSRSFTRRSK